MRQVTKGWRVLVAGLVFSSIAAPAHSQDKLRLTIANGIAPNIPTNWWFKDFIGPELQKQSKGRIDVNIQVNGTLCSEHKCVEQARLGQIDIGSVSGGNIGSFGPTFDILNLPYIFKDDASAEKLINGWLGKELSVRAEKEMGLHIIAIIPSYSFRNVDNSKREVRVPDDLKGLKIRVTKSPVELSLIRTWGGTAVPFDWGQLYEGLQTGVVDGMYIPDAYVAAQKFYEVAKYITVTGGAWNAHIIFMDKKRHDRMPDWARKHIDRIGDEIRAQSFKVDAEWMARQTKLLEGKVKVYQPSAQELDRWYNGAPASWLAVKGTYDRSLARKALTEQGQTGLIKKLEAEKAL
jgi:tripartite ATP-independent transporter DctP family solute receptor